MLEHLLNKEVVVTVALNSNMIMGLTTVIKGTLVGFDDKFIKLENGTVIAIGYIRFITLK